MNSVAFAGLVGDDMGPLTTHAAQSLLSCRASPPPFAVVVEQARQSLPHLQSRLFGMRQAAASKPPSQPRPLLDDACASTNLALAGLNALLSSQGFGLSQAEIISNLPGATVESIEPLLAAISGLPGGALFDEWSVFRQQRGHPFPVDPLSIIASQSKAGCGVANIFPCGSLARSVWSSGPIPDPCLTASDPADISNVITITFKADVSTSALPCSACDGVFSSPQPVCILLHFLPDSTIPEYVQVSAGDTATGPFTECRTIHIVPQSVSSQTGVNVGVVRAHYALINFSAVRPTAPRYYRVAMCGAVDSTPGITSPEYALSSLEFLCQPAILPPLVSTRDVVVTIQSWLTRMFTTTKPGPIRSKLLQAMVSFAGVTGSFGAVLRAVHALLTCDVAPTAGELSLIRSIGNALVDASKVSGELTRAKEWSQAQAALAAKDTRFDPYKSMEVQLNENWTVATCRGTAGPEGGSIAVVDAVIAGNNVYSWTMKVLFGAEAQGMLAMGVAVRDSSQLRGSGPPGYNMILVQCLDGTAVIGGRPVPTIVAPPVTSGATVKFTLDLPARTLCVSVNGSTRGPPLTIPDQLLRYPLQPVVVSSGFNGSITLLSCGRVPTSTPVDPCSFSQPVFLCDVLPTESKPGKGTVGMGCDLGYFPDSVPLPSVNVQEVLLSSATARESSPSLPPSPSTLLTLRRVSVDGQRPSHCISIHPPDDGVASIAYALDGVFATLRFTVAINDDVFETLSDTTFQVVGDGKVIWSSQALRKGSSSGMSPRVMQAAEVSVAGVHTLQLLCTSSGIAALSHAVWVDPILIPVKASDVPATPSRDLGVSGPVTDTSPSDAAPSGSSSVSRAHVQAALDMLRLAVIWGTNIVGPTGSPWWRSPSKYDSGTSYSSDVLDTCLGRILAGEHIISINQSQKSVPFLCEPFADVITLSADIIARLLPLSTSSSGSVTPQIRLGAMLMLTDVFKLVNAQLLPLSIFEISITEFGFEGTAGFQALLTTLLNVVSTAAGASGSVTSLSSLSATAARVISENASLFFPNAAAAITLFTQVAGYATIDDVTTDTVLSGSHPLHGVMLSTFEAMRAKDATFIELLPSVESVNSTGFSFVSLLVSMMDAAAIRFISTGIPSNDFLTTSMVGLLVEYTSLLVANVGSLDVTTVPSPITSHPVVSTLLQWTDLLANSGARLASRARSAIESDASQRSQVLFALHQSSLRSLLLPLMTSLPSLFADVGLARTVVHALLGFGVEYNPLMTQLFDSTALTSACHQWELYHSTFIVGSLGSPNSGNDNLFSTVFTGEQDSFTGQLGYCFVVNEEADVVLTGLGRSINTAIRGGRLQHPHCIRVWDDDSQAIVAQCVVDCDSVVDPAGYRASSLTSPVRLLKGHHYRITSTERAHSGDVWYRPPDGGEMAELLAAVTAAYDTSLVTLTKDCYMPGTGNVFPEQSSGNMIPLGIPTFYVSSPVEWNDLAVSDTVFPSTPANVVVSIKNRETTVALKAGEPTDLGTVTIFPTLGQLQNSKYINTVFALAAHLEGDTAIGIEAKIGSAAGVEGSVRIQVGFQSSGRVFVSRTDSIAQVSSSLLDMQLMAVVQRDDTISIICDADRGLVELFIGQTSYGLIVGPLLTGALLEANMLTLLSSPNVKSERLFVRGLVMLTPSTSAPRPAVTILPDLMSNTVSPFPVSPSSVIHASVSRLGIGPFSLFQLEDVDVVPAHDIQVGVPLHWSVTFSHALSTVLGRASATLIAACPESELEQHLAPWLLLPVLSNGPGNVSDEEQLLAQLSSGYPVLEAYLQAMYPEPPLVQKRPKFPTVEIPFLAALGKHAGVVAEWLAVVDRINSGALDVASLKSNKALLESEKGAFSSTSVAIWTKVKALRQWIRGKKALFQQHADVKPATLFGTSLPPLPTTVVEMVPLLGGSSVLKSNTRKRRVKSSCPLSFEALLDQLVDRAHYFLSVPAVSPVPVDALLHSALTYIRYGALASPPVLKALSVVRTTRALHRQSGLGALLRAIQFQAFPFELDNLLSCVRPALKGIPLSGLERQHRKLHAIIRYCDLPLIGVEDPDSADGLSESMEARYHWMTGLEGSSPVAISGCRTAFHTLLTTLLSSLRGSTPNYTQLSILTAFSLDYEAQESSILSSVEFQSLLSSSGASDIPSDTSDDAWNLLPVKVIREGLLSGALAKKHVLWYLLNCPHPVINHVWFSEHGWPSLQLDALVESVPTSGVIRMYRELYSTVSAAVQGNITTPTDAVFISRVTSTAAAGGASSSASAIPLPPTPSLVDGEEDEETQLMRAIALSAMAFQSTPDPVAAHSPVFEAVDEEDEEALLAQALALSVQQHTTAEVASPTPAPPPLPPTTTPLAPSPPVIPPPPANVPKSSFSIVNALETVSLEQAKLQLLTFLIAGTCGGFEARRKNAILRAGELSSATLPSGTSDVFSEDSKGDVDEEDTKDDDASAALPAPDPTDPDEIPYAATGLKTTALLFTLGGISAITDVRQQLLFVLMSGACERIAQLSSSLPDSAKFTEVSSACVDAQLFRYLMAISQLQPAALFPQSVLTEPTFLRALTDLVGRVIASPRVTAVSSRLLKKILSSSSIVPMGSLVSDVLSSIASRHPLAGQYPVSRLSDPIHAPVGHGSSAGAAIVSHSLSRLLCDLSHSPAWSDAISNELESRVIDGADASASNDRLVSAVTALSLLDGSVGWQMIPGSPIIIHDTPSLAEGRGLSDFGSVSELTNSALATGVLVEYLPRTQLARVVYSQAGSSVGYDLSNIVEVDAANIEPVPVAATVKLSHRLLSAMESILSRPPQLPSGAGGASSRDVQADDDQSVLAVTQSFALHSLLHSRCVSSLARCAAEDASLIQTLSSPAFMIPVMDVALSPIQLPTFVAMRRLRERACVISSGLIEVGQPGYDASLARLDSTAKDALVTRRRVETGAVVPSDPSEPVLTPAEAARREQAKMLVAMCGFDLEDCIFALKRNKDQIDRAADWILDKDAPRILQAERDARAAASKLGKGKSGNAVSASVEKDTVRMKKAAELSMISGMRQEISFHALRLFHDNPDRAMSWMLDDGQEWVRMLDDPKYKESERLANEKAEALAVEREKQTDEAALDDLGAVELLSTTATPLTATDQHSPFSTGQPTGGDPIDSPAVVTHRNAMGPDELVAEPLGSRDEPVPEVVGLRVNGLIILSQCDGGPWSRSSGLFGNVSRNGIESTANSTLVHVHSVDAWTGLSDAGVYSLDCVAKPQLLYGKAVTDADTLRGLFSANEAALGTHFARRLIGHIAANWPPKVPISVGTFGNTESLVQLIKLMAASEYVFQSKASSGALDGPDSTAIAHSSTESKSLRALRALLVKLLAQENRSARHKGRHRRDEDDDEESLLSAVLLKECVSHFKLQAAQKGGRKDSAASNRLMAESLHPYFHTSDYRGEVHLPGAKSIRVTFDHRCSLGAEASLSLFTDKGCSNRIARLSGSVWNPIMVPADRVYYRFTSEKKSSYKKDWGYRFYVSSVSGLQWQNERQVMSDKSLEWASWLLRFLLSDLGESSTGEASSLTSHPLVRSPSVISADITGGMVHNAVVADAIVRYIRTPSLPFKQRAVSLLAHLLKAPQLFPLDKLPDMAVIHSVCNIALKRCVAERSSSKQLFLPEGLLLFAELSVTAAAAQHVFDTRLELRMRKVAEDGIGSPAPQLTRPKLAKSWSGVEPRSQPARFGVGSGFASAVIVSDAAGPLVPPFEVSLPAPYLQGLPLPLPTSTLPPPNKLNHEDLSALLSDVADLAHCLSKGSRLPDRLVCRAWLDSLAHSDFSASPHPLFSGDMPTDGLLRYTGKLHIPGASRLLVQLDNRSNVPIGSQLIVKDGSGRLVSSIGGPVTSMGISSDGHAVCEWFSSKRNECQVLDSTVTYEFTTRLDMCGSVPPASFWGFGLSAFAAGPAAEDRPTRIASYEKLCARKGEIEACVRASGVWTRDKDAALVQYLNDKADDVGKPVVSLPASDLRPTREQFAFKYDVLDDIPLQSIHLRFAVIRLLNYNLDRCIDLFDSPTLEIPNSVALTLRQIGHLLFSDIKSRRLEAAVEMTKRTHANNLSIQLDNMRAMLSYDRATFDPDVSECLFIQAFNQLGRKDPKIWRAIPDTKGSLFNVKYVGEEGLDWGGVFRDAITRVVEDVFSQRFTLCVMCPNGINQDGLNMDKFVPNPKHFSSSGASRVLPMFEFIGRLMGCSLRQKLCLPFDFPSLVWKQLVGQAVDEGDIEAIDTATAKVLSDLASFVGTADDFTTAFSSLAFTANSSDGRVVELKKGGASIAVTPSNRLQYRAALLNFKLHEFDLAVDAMRRGLSSTVPDRAIRLLTWRELDTAVGGKPEINVDLLEKNTEYEGYSSSDPAIKRFWTVLRSFSNEEKSLFVKFVWGRSRLPMEKRWPKKLKIQRRVVPDTDLPIAHTCFFSVELPPYSTEGIMRHKLLTAVHFGAGGILNI